jgi:hypothetical protein
MVFLKFKASLAAPSISTMRKTAMKTMTDKCYTSAHKCFSSGILQGGMMGLNIDFAISIIDDVDIEGSETVNLSSRNPDGDAAFSSPDSAVLAAADNEVAASAEEAVTKVDNSITGETINEPAGVDGLAA